MDIRDVNYIVNHGLDTHTEGVAKKYQNPEGGLNAKGRAHFKRTEGANLKPPVSKKAAKKSPKKAGRRKSFCARMGGQKRMHNIDCRANPDKDICKSLRKWDCNESYVDQLNSVLYEDFTKWPILEESEEERRGREAEAKRREALYGAYAQNSREFLDKAKKFGVGSPEWMQMAGQSMDDPLDAFRNSVYDLIESRTGKDMRYNQVIPTDEEGDHFSEKEKIDDYRAAELVRDCYFDGSSVEEAASMVIDLLDSMGYL